ncbi:hypothetical protein EKK58_10910 [Candidatus Dependentiae bacterium]|nr:MAG: hypothetical protein EKK58_10910 [Candidatus Dependentiae bacterium]
MYRKLLLCLAFNWQLIIPSDFKPMPIHPKQDEPWRQVGNFLTGNSTATNNKDLSTKNNNYSDNNPINPSLSLDDQNNSTKIPGAFGNTLNQGINAIQQVKDCVCFE